MKEELEEAKSLIFNKDVQADNAQNKIGRLNEKSMHALLKYTLEPNDANHEIKVGRYFADIVNANGIYEIQTRSFNAMRAKLSFFLQEHVVTLVYPIARIKHLSWIDMTTGEVTKRRKSPKKGSFYAAFYELYKIKSLLTEPNLRIKLILVNADEYRNLNGWSKDKKRGSSRHEMIPSEIVDFIDINCNADYKKLIPENMPTAFTTKDYQKASGEHLRTAQLALNVLKHVGAIKQVGKKGNSIVYELC